jgi:hypothetical protein
MPTTLSPCERQGHDFQPKRQLTDFSLNGVPRESNVTELWCRRCGMVCILNSTVTPNPQPEGVN